MLLYYTNCLLKLIADIMNRFIFFKTILLSFLIFHTGFSSAQIADLSKASLIASSTIASPVRETAIRILQEEVAQRTSINLRLISGFENSPVIVLASIKDNEINGMPVPKRTGEIFPEMKAEGFQDCA